MNGRIANMGFACAMLVVAIHVSPESQAPVGSLSWAVHYAIRHVLAPVAVPFFFLASGYFMARRADGPGWWRVLVLRRLRTLGVPFLVWCVVPLVLFTYLLPFGSMGGECSRVCPRASAYAAAFGLNLFTWPEANRPLWFMRGLLLLVVLAPLVRLAVRKVGAAVLIVLFALHVVVNPGVCGCADFWLDGRWQIFWRFGFPLEGLFYFALGFRLNERPVVLNRETGLLCGLAGLVVGSVRLVLSAHEVSAGVFLTPVSVALVMAGLWSVIPSSPWPRALVANAFPVYVMHAMFLRLVTEPVPILPRFAGVCFVEWALVFTCPLLLSIGLHRWLPRVSAIVFGGR